MTLPYDHPGYAAGYDARYNLSAINAPHFGFEVALIERLIAQHCASSWCDVACGTGLHLRSVTGAVRRTGIDRSPGMLAQARKHPGPEVEWVRADIRDVAPGDHDLVTALWYGYVHQDSLAGVGAFLQATADQVAEGGTLLLGLCDPLGLFESIPASSPLMYGAPIEIDALVWSLTEPWEGHRFDNCIAPHPKWILDRLRPRFDAVRPVSYPAAGQAGAKWNRKGLIFEGRKKKTKETGIPSRLRASSREGRRGGVSPGQTGRTIPPQTAVPAISGISAPTGAGNVRLLSAFWKMLCVVVPTNSDVRNTT